MELNTRPLLRQASAALAALTVLPTLAVSLPSAHAQTTRTRPNVIQRHPTATGVAAGVATHSLLKRSAAAKKRRGQKLNFAERHPTLSGIGAAIGTRHVVKHSTRRP